ncbi:MAG: [acyl-carrier-protein] S-malonyltransferase [Syntrophus sp. (in: bacteria)]|nr:[acyl-carrier-protein] S-malonyltransferase [Syntrophus sp. (in: bacteria)]
MKKVGIVFPGQGAQYVGMGKKLYDSFDFVKEYFARADKVLGFSITDLCFSGPDDELRQTYNTQPSLLLVSYAVWQVIKNETGLKPYLVAGHSLGEYTALLASGYFTFEDALIITRKRGLLMEEACPQGKGGMAALIGADMTKVGPLLKEISHDDYVVVPANLNSSEQVVLSGDTEALKEAVEKLKGAYKKAVFLNVSGPFHSPLMTDAAEKLKSELSKFTCNDMEVPVVFNVDATPCGDKHAVQDKLYKQMFSPVQWEMSVKKMAEQGVELFIEVGPQKVLTNLIKRIVPGIPCYNVESPEEIEAIKGLIV